MSQAIRRLSDFNLSGQNPEQIIKLFWSLVYNIKEKFRQENIAFICQHTVKIIKDKQLEYTNENCSSCQTNRQLKIKVKYQLVGILFYLFGGLQEQIVNIYDFAKQKFESLLGIFEDRQQFTSYCSIINEKELEKKKSLKDPNNLISPYEDIKLQKYSLIIVDNCKGFLSNNKNQDEAILVSSFEGFLNKFQQFINDNQINFNPCLHNIYLGQFENDIQMFKINIFNTACNCKNQGFPIVFFSYLTGKNYDSKYQKQEDQDDFDISPLIKDTLRLIKENQDDSKEIDDQIEVLLEILQKYQQNQKNNSNQQIILQTRYPTKQYKISFFAFQISQILVTLDEKFLWEGYKIYVLQDLSEMVENEILEKNLFENIEKETIVKADNYQNLLHFLRFQQCGRIYEFNKKCKKQYFTDIIDYYGNDQGQENKVDGEFSNKIQWRFIYFQFIKDQTEEQSTDVLEFIKKYIKKNGNQQLTDIDYLNLIAGFESYGQLKQRRENYQQLNPFQLELYSKKISRQNSLNQNQRNQQMQLMASVRTNDSIHQSQQFSSQVVFRQSKQDM